MTQLVGIAHEMERSDRAVLDFKRARLGDSCRIAREIAGQAVDAHQDGGARGMGLTREAGVKARDPGLSED